MLGPIGANLMSILKVLTPSDIDVYSSKIEEEEVLIRPLAVGAEGVNYGGTSSSSGDQPKKNLVSENDTEEHNLEKAKIIPLNQKIAEELEAKLSEEIYAQKIKIDQNLKVNVSPGQSGGNSLSALGILSQSDQYELDKEKQRKENEEKESTSVFILNQRDVLKKSRMRLVEQKAIAQYQKNSNSDFALKEQSEGEEEESQENGSKGILVNKRHY